MTLLALPSLLLAQMPSSHVSVMWTGGHSAISKAEVKIIDSESAWIMSWTENRGDKKRTAMWRKLQREHPEEVRYDYYSEDQTPVIDFANSFVLAIFGGKTRQNAGYSLISSEAEGDTVTLRYVPRFYSTVSNNLNDPQFENTPYAYFLMPRDFKHVRVEEAIVESKGKPPTKFKLIKLLDLK